jgi:hypothetical protein
MKVNQKTKFKKKNHQNTITSIKIEMNDSHHHENNIKETKKTFHNMT